MGVEGLQAAFNIFQSLNKWEEKDKETPGNGNSEKLNEEERKKSLQEKFVRFVEMEKKMEEEKEKGKEKEKIQVKDENEMDQVKDKET